MSWIKVIPFEEATGKLKTIYHRIKGPNNQIDNVLSIHSLRPHTLSGHMSLYKNVLHHTDNTFDNWFLELLGTYTSYLNKCDYCFEHHYTGMKSFLNNSERSEQLRNCIFNDDFTKSLTEKETALVLYTKKLTQAPHQILKEEINNLKKIGVDDGEILEINQVVAYFNYVNRTVLGLGVNTTNEIIGLSPKNKDSDSSWTHE